MTNISLNATVLVSSAALLGGFFAYLYRQKQQSYLLVWSAAWVALSAHLLVLELVSLLSSRWLFALDYWLLAIGAITFYVAVQLYTRGKLARYLIAGALAVAGLWCATQPVPFWKEIILVGVGVLFFNLARAFWVQGHKQESQADKLLAMTFAAWGLLYILISIKSYIPPAAHVRLLPLTFLPLLFSGVLMVATVYEEERRHLERNMLALSNLNLATSSFVGGEIQKMLAQALDRILNVVRIPAGALCLHYGETSGPTTVVVTGLDDSFCSAVQVDSLDEYTMNLVARLGGLVVLGNSLARFEVRDA